MIDRSLVVGLFFVLLLNACLLTFVASRLLVYADLQAELVECTNDLDAAVVECGGDD